MRTLTLHSTRLSTAALAVLAVLAVTGIAAAAAGLDPKVALKPEDQALAHRIVLQRSDFGAGWALKRLKLGAQSIAAGSLCSGFRPDLSRLTVTGQAASRATNTAKSAVAVALVFQNPAQARAIAQELQAPFVRHCFQEGKTRNGVRVDSVVRDSLLGNARFRLGMTFVAAHKRYFADYVFLTRGREWVSVVFSSVGLKLPASIEPRAIQSLQQRVNG
jgi:Flp pilus assembly protein CpaB